MPRMMNEMGGDGMDEKPMTDAAEPREDTFFLPSDFPGADSLKPGDTLTLKVVGKDAEGDIEVEHMTEGGKGEMSMADDLRQTMGPESGPEEQY